MPVLQKTYEVISGQAVMVDLPGGNATVFPSGSRFTTSPTNKSVIRLLRLNAIREVTKRELPNFNSGPTA
jgi:hypothetical protein